MLQVWQNQKNLHSCLRGSVNHHCVLFLGMSEKENNNNKKNITAHKSGCLHFKDVSKRQPVTSLAKNRSSWSGHLRLAQKASDSPQNPVLKMPSFTAMQSMFTARCKNKFGTQWIISLVVKTALHAFFKNICLFVYS